WPSQRRAKAQLAWPFDKRALAASAFCWFANLKHLPARISPVSVSRAQRSAQRSEAVRCRTGTVIGLSLRRSRVSSATLHVALRPGHEKNKNPGGFPPGLFVVRR